MRTGVQRIRHIACIVLSSLLAAPASTTRAQDSGSALEPQLHVLPANTEVHLNMLEPVASHTHKRGDRFRLVVAEAVLVDGRIVIAAGAPGEGEVIHAAKPGMAGKAGELILAARFVRNGEHEIRLRSFTAGVGADRLSLATGLGVTLGIPALFVVGKNLVVPEGADVIAKVAVDTPLPSLGTVAAEVPPPAASFESSTEPYNNESSQQ